MAKRSAPLFAGRKSVPEAELNLRIGDMSVEERQDGPAFEPNPYSSKSSRDATGPRLHLSNPARLELVVRDDGIWKIVEALIAILEASTPTRRLGRKRESGVFDIVLFGVATWVYGSWLAVHDNMADPETWGRLVRAAEDAWPDHPQRRLSPSPPNRWKHYRARQSYLNDYLCDVMAEKYRGVAAEAAVGMGMFDPTSGSFTRPAKTQLVQGDGTWVSAASKIHRSKAFDAKTGKTRRHDPNADHYHDKKDKKYRAGPGRMLVKIIVHNSNTQERIILDTVAMPPRSHPARKGRNDADFAVDMFLRFIEENPETTKGAHGLIYDMAIDSEAIDRLQDAGRHAIAKVSRIPGGDYSSVNLGMHDFKTVDGGSFSRKVIGADGSTSVRYVDGDGNGVLVELERVQTKRNRRKDSTAIYSEYRIPDEPVVNRDHVGATTWVRHNSTPAERQTNPHRRRTRALRTVAESEPAFKVYGARQTTESSNSDLKRRLPEKRLRTYNDTDLRLDMLTYQMMWLVTAQAAYRQRMSRSTDSAPSEQRLPAGEEPIPIAA